MPGVNNTKRIPCARNPKDHGHHPQNEKCGYCPTVSPFADTLPVMSEYDPYDDMIYKLWCGLSEETKTDIMYSRHISCDFNGVVTRFYSIWDDTARHNIQEDTFIKMLGRDLKENPSP